MKTVVLALILTVPAFAQQPVNRSAPADAKPVADQPVVSQLQMVEIDDYDTHIQGVVKEAQTAIAPWQTKKNAVVNEVLAANPGWAWHEGQGPGDPSRFVKVPPKPEKPAEVKPVPATK